MKKVRILPLLHLQILMIFMVFLLSVSMSAEERSIYVGDLISLKLSTKVSESEIRDKFKDFEIVDIDEEQDGYKVTLRSFEVGEKTVTIGDKELKITIKSTLDEIDRKDIFEGELNPEKAKFSFNWQILFFVLLGVFIITGGLSLRMIIKNRNKAKLSPYEYFKREVDTCALNDEALFVKLTMHFKRYLESKYSFNIKGKTSTEIIQEIKYIPDLIPMISVIETWLTEGDYYKFSGVSISADRRQEALDRLMYIARKIEEAKEDKV